MPAIRTTASAPVWGKGFFLLSPGNRFPPFYPQVLAESMVIARFLAEEWVFRSDERKCPKKAKNKDLEENHFYILTKLALINHPKPFSNPKTRCCLAGSCAIEKAQAAEVVTSKTRSCSYNYSRWCQWCAACWTASTLASPTLPARRTSSATSSRTSSPCSRRCSAAEGGR